MLNNRNILITGGTGSLGKMLVQMILEKYKPKRLMKEHGLSAPVFLEEGNSFVVKFYSPQDKILDLVPSISKERQTDLKELGLNERQIEALRLMVNEGKEFTNAKYRETFKVCNKTFVRDMRLMSQLELITSEGRGRSIKFKARLQEHKKMS